MSLPTQCERYLYHSAYPDGVSLEIVKTALKILPV